MVGRVDFVGTTRPQATNPPVPRPWNMANRRRWPHISTKGHSHLMPPSNYHVRSQLWVFGLCVRAMSLGQLRRLGAISQPANKAKPEHWWQVWWPWPSAPQPRSRPLCKWPQSRKLGPTSATGKPTSIYWRTSTNRTSKGKGDRAVHQQKHPCPGSTRQ